MYETPFLDAVWRSDRVTARKGGRSVRPPFAVVSFDRIISAAPALAVLEDRERRNRVIRRFDIRHVV